MSIILFFILSACSAENNLLSSGQLGKEEFSAYGVTLGDSKEFLIEEIGVPDSKDTDSIYNIEVLVYKYPHISFFLYEDKVVQVESVDTELNTLSGIGVETPLKQVKDVYKKYKTTTGESIFLVNINEEKSLLFSFREYGTTTNSTYKVDKIIYRDDSAFDIDQRQAFNIEEINEKLIWETRDGNIDEVRNLLEAGADLNYLSEEGNKWTAIMYAALQGNTDLVSILLEGGADPNIISESDSALLLATKNNHYQVVELLLKAGAEPDADALEYAKKWDYPKIVSLLEGGTYSHRDLSLTDLEKNIQPMFDEISKAAKEKNAEKLFSLFYSSQNNPITIEDVNKWILDGEFIYDAKLIEIRNDKEDFYGVLANVKIKVTKNGEIYEENGEQYINIVKFNAERFGEENEFGLKLWKK